MLVIFSFLEPTPATGLVRVKLELLFWSFMRPSLSTWWILAAWILFVGSYAGVSLLLRPGPGLTTYGDLAQCVVPLFANAGLLLNAGSSHWRRNSFWMLMALGCTLWMVAQLLWTYFEIYLHQPVPNPFTGDFIFFLHTVPMIAALALEPHKQQPEPGLRFGYLDFSLLSLWWVYLYLFVVIPWRYVLANVALYGQNYNLLNIAENMVLLTGLGAYWLRTSGRWRVIYANLFGAACCYTTSSLAINVGIDRRGYYTGSFYDNPPAASFFWFGAAGMRASQESIENLQRLQTQFVQAEKLASLGQLAAGAAHEINNPLTAILGYSDLLIDDGSLGEKPRTIATKIRDQARRTKTLVTNLLSFARQVPPERKPLDVNAVVSSAIQLRQLALRGRKITIELRTEPVLPGVRGDSNQLLQVFFDIISNAVDAMEEIGGGVLNVRTLRDRANVVIEFSDTGPGIKEPHLVFDPFYTTKPVGKGTGLGLSICYGLEGIEY